jgi:hypothetical protein
VPRRAQIHEFFTQMDARRARSCACFSAVVAASGEGRRIAYFDTQLNGRVLDLTAAHQHDVNMFLLSRFQQGGTPPAGACAAPAAAADELVASMDSLMVIADASMGHGAGHGVCADFWVNVAVEGAAGAAGAPANAPLTRNLGVHAGEAGAEAGPHAVTQQRIGDNATLLLLASEACFVYVFHLGPDGSLTALMPSLHSAGVDNKLRAGVVRRMPQPGDGVTVKFEPPAGLESVYVVATREPWPEWLVPFQACGGVGDARALYRALAQYTQVHAQRRGLATCVHKFRTTEA